MSLSFLWNFFLGYVIIELEGFNLNGFLHSAAQNGIEIKQVRRVSYTGMEALVTSKNYFAIRRLAAQWNITVRDKRRGGSLGLAGMARRRIALLIGIVLLIGAVWVMSLYVMRIDITGFETVSEFAIYNEIREMGVREGMLKSDVDLETVAEGLKDTFPKIVYANAYFNGVDLTVEVVEGELPPELKPIGREADVISKKDALVMKVIAKRGEAAVKPGDVVAKGDILINGQYIAKETLFSTSAEGSVTGKVWYTGTAKVDYKQKKLEGTGQKKTARYIRIGKNGYPVFIPDVEYKSYIIRETTDTVLGQNLPMPVHIVEAEIEQAVEVDDKRALELAKLAARELAYANAMKDIPQEAELKNFAVSFKVKDGVVAATAQVMTIEEIGLQKFTGEGS